MRRLVLLVVLFVVFFTPAVLIARAQGTPWWLIAVLIVVTGVITGLQRAAR